MKIEFEIDDAKIVFTRNAWTGRATLTTPQETRVLQSPSDLSTHFSTKIKRHWQHSFKGHEIVIEKQRPLLFAGLRPQTYRVFVNNALLKEQSGF